MEITKDILANQILKFLNRKLSLEELVNWAENSIIEANYQEIYFEEIADILAKIGVSNVKGFELTTAFYLNTLIKLDYIPHFDIKNKIENQENIFFV